MSETAKDYSAANTAAAHLEEAERRAYEGSPETFSVAVAIVGVGWAALAIADAIENVDQAD